jgi:hypothetical protein
LQAVAVVAHLQVLALFMQVDTVEVAQVQVQEQ